MYAATRALATTCRPASEICCPPARNAAIAPSIDGWRRTVSSRSRTAGRIIRGNYGLGARRRNAVADFIQYCGGGVAGHDGHRHAAAASRLHLFAADDLITGPVATFNEHVRERGGDHALRRQVIENQHAVDALERRKNFRALALRNDWAALALELPDTRVAVQADNQRIAEAARVLQAGNVAGMQQVEAAIGEDHATAIAFPAAKPQNRLLQGKDGIQRVSVPVQPDQIVKPERLVYHARELRLASQGARP